MINERQMSAIKNKATEIIAMALKNGRMRAVYVMPDGGIKHYPEDGTLAARIVQRHDCRLIGYYNGKASINMIVEDVLEALER